MVTRITDYFLYRWRYLLGYGVIFVLIIALLAVAWLIVPGGLTTSEMDSTVTSSSLTFSLQTFKPEAIVNLPYHLLQHASFSLFGVSNLTIKLPSLILGLFSALGILLLLRMWFKRNVAVITTVLVITTSQFLFLTQEGTPTIVYIFWSVWLLVSALMVSRKAKWSTAWKIALFGFGALSLYTPLEIYIIIALLSAMALHPHLRYIVRRLSKPRLALGIVCGLILLAPLIYTIVKEPSVGLQLLGMPTASLDILANIKMLFEQYFSFINPGGRTSITPIYGLGTCILILLGIIQLFTTKYTARGYIIIAWTLLLLPVIVINPQYVSVTFIPVVLLMAMGVSMLITRWYRLFPRNPYARIAGLIPLAVLIGGMVFSGVDRYMYGYGHIPSVASQFSRDLSLLNKQLAKKDIGNTVLIVSNAEMPFYAVVAKYAAGTSVVVGGTGLPDATTYIASRAGKNPEAGPADEIITNDMYREADRFYIYKTK
ncbi:MAG TPA: glycosyltransferase family 39 protein [Candidatus Saccharimonadales bacterium]|nr:glycosyltransferase family 39 protein [Candidatus Saccharimonadales bacterium]